MTDQTPELLATTACQRCGKTWPKAPAGYIHKCQCGTIMNEGIIETPFYTRAPVKQSLTPAAPAPELVERVARGMRAHLGLEGDPPQATLDLAQAAIAAMRPTEPDADLTRELADTKARLAEAVGIMQGVVGNEGITDFVAFKRMTTFLAKQEASHD